MDLKININKIHADLLNQFGEVQIFEKSSLEFGEYIQIETIFEGKELIMIVKKRELESPKFNWSYYSNPITKDALVERFSSLDSIGDDVMDIFQKVRFDTDYIKQI